MEFLKELRFFFGDFPTEVPWLIGGASVIFFGLIIYGFVQILLHGDEPSKISTGIKGAIFNVSIGCIAFACCWLVVGLSLGVIYAPVWFFTVVLQLPLGFACFLEAPLGFYTLIYIYRIVGIR